MRLTRLTRRRRRRSYSFRADAAAATMAAPEAAMRRSAPWLLPARAGKPYAEPPRGSRRQHHRNERGLTPSDVPFCFSRFFDIAGMSRYLPRETMDNGYGQEQKEDELEA